MFTDKNDLHNNMIYNKSAYFSFIIIIIIIIVNKGIKREKEIAKYTRNKI